MIGSTGIHGRGPHSLEWDPPLRSTVLAEGFGFPECPRWHDGAIWLADMHTGEVSSVALDSGVVTVEAKVPGSAAGLAWKDDGTLLAVSMTDRAVYAISDGEAEVFTDTRPLSASRTNELESDGRGGFYVGSVGFSLMRESPRPSDLGRISPDGRLHIVARDLLCPNGMALSPDGDELFVAETFGNRVSSFRLDHSGTPVARRTALEFGPEERPDGIDVDDDGNIWVAFMGSRLVRRYDRSGSTLTVQATQPAYACRLVGDDRNVLAICAAVGLDLADLDRRAGTLETVELPH